MIRDKYSCIDIVCDMEVLTDEISLDYQGCHYVFCSHQCLERFKSNPNLYIGYPGRKAPRQSGLKVLKKRTIKLSDKLPDEILLQVIDYLKMMMGIYNVNIDKDRIEIVYDLLMVTEKQIEQAIIDANIVLGDELSERIRRSFVHYLEETEIESLEARPDSKGMHCK